LVGAEHHRERVDEERHVVGDDLDDRVAAGRPLVLVDRRRRDPDGCRPLRPQPGEAVLADRRSVDVGGRSFEQIVGCDVLVVRLEQCERRIVVEDAAPTRMTGGRRRLDE
jgi:hypothetical protein